MSITLTATREERAADGGLRPALILALEGQRPAVGSLRVDLGDLSEVALGRGSNTIATELPGKGRVSIDVADTRMSGKHAKLVRVAGHRWIAQDLGSKNGTVLNGQPIDRFELVDGDVLELGRSAFLFRLLPRSTGDRVVQIAATDQSPPPSLSPELSGAYERLVRIAASGVSVLVYGETGSGKEVVARAVHGLSGRSGPFVAVNCAALVPSLAQSELFGHVQGAFSGAQSHHDGFFTRADGGTLFLDQIGDLPGQAQGAILRAIQEKEVTPVGSTAAKPTDLRIVAATHRDLDALIDSQSFRADLHARLAGFELTLPPLRERREDIGLIAGSLLAKQAGPRITLGAGVARALLRYDWPRNVRELEQALVSALALSGDGTLALSALPKAVRKAAAPVATAPPALGDVDQALRTQLTALFTEHHGNVSAVARAMGKNRRQIQRWMERLSIVPDDFK